MTGAPIPAEPAAWLDKDGDAWKPSGDAMRPWRPGTTTRAKQVEGYYSIEGLAEQYGPLTPLYAHPPVPAEVIENPWGCSDAEAVRRWKVEAQADRERAEKAEARVKELEERDEWGRPGRIVARFGHGRARYRVDSIAGADASVTLLTGARAGSEMTVPLNTLMADPDAHTTALELRIKDLEADSNDYRERLVATDQAYAKKAAEAEGYKAALEAAEAQNRAERNAVTARLAEEAARADVARAAAEYTESKRELFEARTAAARARAAAEAMVTNDGVGRPVSKITTILHLPRREYDGAVTPSARCGQKLSSAATPAHLETTVDRFKAYLDPENDLTLPSFKDVCADCVALLPTEAETSEEAGR